MRKVRFAVVGLGTIGRVHISAVQKAPAAELVAVVDADAARAESMGKELGVPWYTAVEELVAREKIDVVNICTPSGLHLEPALAAVKGGCHVLVEKPLEVTVERCDQIIRACRRAGVKLGAIFQNRLFDANRMVWEAVRQQRFGRLILGVVNLKWWRSQDYYDAGAWRGTWAIDGGGAVMNQGIHRIDLLQWLFGEVESVYAHAACLAHERIEVEDTAVAVLRFKSGAVGSVIASTAAYPGFPARLEVHGDQGGTVVEDNKIIAWHGRDISPEEEARVLGQFAGEKRAGAMADPAMLSHIGHERQIADMALAVLEDREPMVTGLEARKSVAIIEAIYASARSGQPVAVSIPELM